MASRAEQILIEHPGAGAMLITRVRAPLARELMTVGLVTCEARRNGALAVSLTDEGRRRKLDLEASPRSPRPPALSRPRPSARSAASRAAPAAPDAPASPAAPAAPAVPAPAARQHAQPDAHFDPRRLPATQRVPSLDELFSPVRRELPDASPGERPATVADLQALEARLLARFEQLLAQLAPPPARKRLLGCSRRSRRSDRLLVPRGTLPPLLAARVAPVR